MNLRILVLGFPLALTACAKVSETYSPDGRKAYAINCSGIALGWDKCFQAAGEKCADKGYEVLSRNQDNQAVLTANSMFGVQGSESVNRSLLISCKE